MYHEITIVQLNESKLNDLAKLFKSVFGIEHSAEYLKTKYTFDSSLPSYCGFFAYVNSEPIAFCGGVPCNLSYNGLTLKGIQFCDTMTLENWSGKGIFQKVSKSLEKYALDHQLILHFAFLNEHSYWAYKKKMDWEIIGTMRRYTIKGSYFPWHKLFSSIAPIRLLCNRYIERKIFQKQAKKPFESKSREKNKCCITRKDDFYHNLPPNHYLLDINGNTTWVKLKNEGHIGNMDLAPETNVPEFIKSLSLLIKKLGIQQLHIQLLEGDHRQILLEKSNKSLSSWDIGAKSFDSRIPAKDLHLVYGDIDTFV